MPADVRTNGITVTKNTAGFLGGIGFFSKDNRYDALFLSNYVDLYVKDAHQARAGVGNVIIFGERKFAMRLLARSGQAGGRGLTRRRRRQRAARAERAGGGRRVGDAPASAEQMYPDQRPRDGPALRGAAVRGHRRQVGPATARSCASRTSGASSWAPRPTRRTCASAASRRRGIGIQLLPSANALEAFQGVMTRDGSGSRRASRRASSGSSRSTTSASSASRSSKCSRRWPRRSGWSSS